MGLRQSKITLFWVILTWSWFFQSCAEPDTSEEIVTVGPNSTLSNETIGNGETGPVEEYFYNFDDAIDASFFIYNGSRFDYTYDKYRQIFNDDPPALSMRNFPDYLLNVSPDSTHFLTRYTIDTLVIGSDTVTSEIGKIVPDSILLSSSQFKNLESIEWDLDAEPSLQRYRLRNSDWVQADTMLYYADTFDVVAYWAVLDTPLIQEGILFVDSSEWRDTSYSFIKDDPIIFINNFEFERTQLSSDSLIFRINTDCNDNNEWDGAEENIGDYNGDGDSRDVLAETIDNVDYNNDGDMDDIVYEFVDRGNGILDPAEVFHDIDGDGEFDLNEPYEDRNCNNRWDDAETEDVGNDIFDDTEQYTLVDIDGDGTPEKQLYLIGEVPNNLLVNWNDPENPEVMLAVELEDNMTDRWGNVYSDIIETINFINSKRQDVGDIDSMVTLYTRQVVGHITDENRQPDDYYITKTEWTTSNAGDIQRHYNYQIYSQDQHVNQLVYPRYFLPQGFYWSPNQIRNGFWHKQYLDNVILFYTYNGLLRNGEQVDTTYYDTTDIAIYYIEKSFGVETTDITIQAARVKGSNNGDGTWTCFRDNSVVSDANDCPSADTTFSDCFKVTHLLSMTMLGSGVEYGEKSFTWLAKDHGIVKSELFLRWSEHPFDETLSSVFGAPDSLGQVWVGYSRLDLAEIDVEKSGNVLRQLIYPPQIVHLNDLGIIPDFNFDPFRVSAQSGMQTIDFRALEP